MRLELSLLLMGIADTMDSDKFDGSFKKVALSISTKGPGILLRIYKRRHTDEKDDT